MSFKFMDHDADIKIFVSGKSINEIFNQSALAFSKYVVKDAKIKKVSKKNVSIEGRDMKNLLYLFLDEMIFLLDAEDFILSNAKVSVKDNALKVTFVGDKASSYKNLTHVKGATYAEMYLKKVKNAWNAQFVLDV